MHTVSKISAAALLLVASVASQAADWSDTSIGYRFGNKYAEPFNTNDVKKNIFNLNHASGYKYGSNFFNADLLLSDEKDPSAFGSTDGAQEVYIVYRHTLDLAKIGGPALKFPGVRGSGITLGFDANTKTDVGYNSKKRMLVAGPTLFMDVPGFLNVSVLLLDESNQPSGTTFSTTPSSRFSVSRYRYKTHAMLTAAWGIPLSKTVPVSFEGFMNFIGSKGVNEFGGATKPETNIDAQVMLDVGALAGGAKGTFKVGIEYQYWKNKFGNPASGPAGKGAFAKTPMLRAEYHF
ncbi:MAG: outer envelope protein [Burkholderiales bacterium]|nr:outer envelope protein [Burkholderiales bacterium]